MKKLLFVLATFCAFFALTNVDVSADQKSYDVSSWQQMYDDYTDACNNSNADTVVLNVTNDLASDPANSQGIEVQNGRSVIIKGNGYTLDFGASYDPSSTTNVSESGTKNHSFYSSDSSVTSGTTLRIENATVINSINYGIFEISADATATTQYYNVTEMNGGANSGGSTPILNRAGHIEFSGTNVFNISGDSMVNYGGGKQSPDALGDTDYKSGDQSNWIEGNNINVVSGSTTLNLNAVGGESNFSLQTIIGVVW